jgi:hypothetical protein
MHQGFKYRFDPKNRSPGITEIREFYKYRSKFSSNSNIKIWGGGIQKPNEIPNKSVD